MNNTLNSPGNKPANKGANRRKVKQGGFGCGMVFVLLVVGVLVAVVVWGPGLINQFVNPAIDPPRQADHPSHEQLLVRRQQEIAQLHSYGWVDQKAGVAHIPIDRAIALVAASGLPVGSEQTAGATTPPEAADAPVDLANVNYQDHVLPIFQQHCAECHGDEKSEEGLKLTSYRAAINGSQNGPVIEPGDPDNSYLVKMVVSGKMPKRGPKLSQAEIDMIIAWIKAGAKEN
jgi:mono/diheme cytochrome c family protein